MAAYITAYITASISAKLQCNFLTPYFSPYPITQTTPHGYFWWDSEPGRGEEGEAGEGCLWSNLPSTLLSSPSSPLINFELDCLASSIISIKFPWIKPSYETLSSSCLSNTKFQISFCFKYHFHTVGVMGRWNQGLRCKEREAVDEVVGGIRGLLFQR